MPGRYAKKLACEIIQDQFGELVGKVCRTLLFRGVLSLPEIGRFTGLPLSQLRSCLLVLCQHNCVQAFRPLDEGDVVNPKIPIQYAAILSRILNRLRFPRFLLLVKEVLGAEEEAVLEGLLEHGRLTLQQIIQRAAARANKSESEISDDIRKHFTALVRASFVQRASKPEPHLPNLPGAELAKRGLRASQRSRAGAVAKGLGQTEEERMLAVAAPAPSDRFRLPSSVLLGADNVPAEEPAKKKRKVLGAGLLQVETGALGREEEKDAAWCVNYEEFLRRFRHQRCVEMVKAKFSPDAATIVRVMLEETRILEEAVKEPTSGPLPLEAIAASVKEDAAGGHITMESARKLLMEMAGSTSAFVTKVTEGIGGGSFVVNTQAIVRAMHEKEMEGIWKWRYGAVACRIMRLLVMTKQLEQKQIAEMVMMPIKDTRELLYTLLKAEYLQLQEVAKTADHAPSRTFYLWRADLKLVMPKMAEDMFKAASNLRQRLACELDKEKDVLSILEDIHLASATGAPSAAHVSLTSSQRRQLERVRVVAAALEASLLQLDESMMLLSDF